MTSPTGEPLTVEVVTKEIIDLLRPELKGAELTADSSLVSSGLDSVSIVSLIYKVEKRYSIVLEEEEGRRSRYRRRPRSADRAPQ